MVTNINLPLHKKNYHFFTCTNLKTDFKSFSKTYLISSTLAQFSIFFNDFITS